MSHATQNPAIQFAVTAWFSDINAVAHVISPAPLGWITVPGPGAEAASKSCRMRFNGANPTADFACLYITGGRIKNAGRKTKRWSFWKGPRPLQGSSSYPPSLSPWIGLGRVSVIGVFGPTSDTNHVVGGGTGSAKHERRPFPPIQTLPKCQNPNGDRPSRLFACLKNYFHRCRTIVPLGIIHFVIREHQTQGRDEAASA